MNYKTYRTLDEIKPYWETLVIPSSKDFYQTYDFAKICYKYRKTSVSNIINRNRKCLFIIAFDNRKPLCIAPLTIDDKKKTVHILGHGTNAGYLNFIYDKKTTFEHVKQLLLYCKRKLYGYKFEFNFIPLESYLGRLLKIENIIENFYIEVSSYDDYFNGLSKSTRQNIRTSYNRLIKDDKNINLCLFDRNSSDLEDMLKYVNKIYQKRRTEWDSSYVNSYMKSMKILKRDVIYQSLRNCDSAILVVLKIDGQIGAFFIGYKRNNHIYIPRLAINTEYKRYSPGFLLIFEYFKCEIKKSKKFIFDLGRGDENYKKVLGGDITLSIKGVF